MGASEYETWWRYWQVEPWGAHRDNLHAGLIASAVVNSSPNKRRGVSVSASDFMLKSRAEVAEAETAETLAALEALSVKR
jgi:hypothetical protein